MAKAVKKRETPGDDPARGKVTSDSMARATELMLKSPFFADLHWEQAVDLVKRCRLRRYRAGDVLIREGEVGDFACLLLDGAVDISARGKSIVRRGAGDLLGEMALLDDDVRSSSVTALGDVATLVISKEAMIELLFRQPQLYRNIVRILIGRLRSAVTTHVSQAVQKSNLERFLSPNVAARVLSDAASGVDLALAADRVEATILFSDIKGFTKLSERLSPEEVAELLNAYFTRMTEIVFKHHGTLDKYIGDGLMAVFGTPKPERRRNHAFDAVKAARAMIEAHAKFARKLDDRRKFEIRIGVNTGAVVAGYLGSPKRMEYSVLGEPVVIACRLEALAQPGSVYLGESTRDLIGGKLPSAFVAETTTPKGTKTIRVYKLG